ncbi:MAG: M23 family metallopeptidase [Candidatus Faecousia sp.]|nr:M23 family metallopeptidase [Candidatus Faecousia sp.]
MSDNKRSRRGGKGYYIALILCAVAIGITGYVYYRNANSTQEVSLQETAGEIPALIPETEDVPVIATQAPAQTTAPAATETTSAPTEKKPLKTMSPVDGASISGYSMEALSYNQTTRDWRVHNGVDLAAEAGAEVHAAADGEVYTVYEDDAMGYTVVIRHDDGYTSKYSSLAENLAVKPGDSVTMGQTIGYASDSAIVESTLGSHVHFSVTCHDEPVDPAEFLAIGN